MTGRFARTCTCPVRYGWARRREACGTSSSPWPPGQQENAAAWARLPPLEGANRFTGVKPGATILAEADGKEHRPLLVSQEWGSGRVIAFAGDSTWRWVMRGFGSAHKRFWRQIVLWLARKDQMAGRQCLGAAGQHAVLPRQSRRVHRRGPVAAERADRRRRIQGRGPQARQQAVPRRDDPQRRAGGRFVPRDATARRLRDRGHGDAAGRSCSARRGRDSSSCSRTSNWTTPPPISTP